MRSIFSILFFTLGILFVIFSTTTIAQSLTPDISLFTVPTDPKPLESVTIRAQSYGIDLDQATISWKYNGQFIASGVGQTQVSVTAPASGQTGTITATVIGVGAESTTATLILRPASVDILWEAVGSYTPPFYRGKALAPLGGIIRATAIPNAGAPRGLVYKWSRNGSALSDDSGYNKNSILFKHTILNPFENISLQTQSGAFSGSGAATVTPRSPSLLVYQNIDGFIDYAHGNTGAVTATGPGTILRFEPYYFSIPNKILSDVSFRFVVDGTELSGDGEGNELRFSRPDAASVANIDTTVTTTNYSLQNIKRLFTLEFN